MGELVICLEHGAKCVSGGSCEECRGDRNLIVVRPTTYVANAAQARADERARTCTYLRSSKAAGKAGPALANDLEQGEHEK